MNLCQNRVPTGSVTFVRRSWRRIRRFPANSGLKYRLSQERSSSILTRMNHLSHSAATRSPAIPQALPARAWAPPKQEFPGEIPAEMGALLLRLIQDESALYAITRDWRYDAESRKFTRLHALLDEQFSEIGTRLVRLAKHHRALTSWNSAGHGGRTTPMPTVAGDDGLEIHVIRQLLERHAAMLVALKHGAAAIPESIHVRATHQLLADLAAEHEKDAFMLRALLWEVQQTPA